MTTTATTLPTSATSTQEGELLPAYLRHIHRIGLSPRARRDRERIARDFLGAHPDLQAWMDHPAATRRAELKGSGAWPLLVYAIGTGRLRLDIELATTKQLQGLGAIIEYQHREDFEALRATGLRLGWTPDWVDTVLYECLAVILAGTGGTVNILNSAVLQGFDDELAACPDAPPSSVRAYRARLASLRRLLFEVGVLDEPPQRRPWARTLEQRFADVPMAQALRARPAALRPGSFRGAATQVDRVPGQRPAALRGVPHCLPARGHQPA